MQGGGCLRVSDDEHVDDVCADRSFCLCAGCLGVLVFLVMRMDCSRCDDASMQNMHIVYVAVMSRSEINVLRHVVKDCCCQFAFRRS